MTDLPVTSAPPLPIATLDPSTAAIDRFLARVAALMPAQWGELDAIGQRLQGGDPISRWQRARQATALGALMPTLRDALTVLSFAVDLFDDAERAVLGKRRVIRRWQERPTSAPPLIRRTPAMDRYIAASSELLEIARMQPGGPGAAHGILDQALLALWLRSNSPTTAFTEMYAAVEPIIPAASL